jgi:hypothetical protein
VRKALDGLRDHPLRGPIEVIASSAGMSPLAQSGVKIRQTAEGHYAFRLSFRPPIEWTSIGASSSEFLEFVLTPASMSGFAAALLDKLRCRGCSV